MGATRTCIVCGVEARDRCARCGQGGVDILFCGVEHQRLIWPTHRAVCGPAAVQCFAPPLSDSEVAAARQQLRTATPAVPTSLLAIPGASQVLLGNQEALLDRYLHSNHTPLAKHTDTIRLRNTTVIARRTPGQPFADLFETPWELAASLELLVFTDILEHNGISSAVAVVPHMIRHRILVLATLVVDAAQRKIPPAYPPARRRLLAHAFGALVTACSAHVRWPSIDSVAAFGEAMVGCAGLGAIFSGLEFQWDDALRRLHGTTAHLH